MSSPDYTHEARTDQHDLAIREFDSLVRYLEMFWLRVVLTCVFSSFYVCFRHDNDRSIPRTPAEIYELNRAIVRRMNDVFTSRGVPVVPCLGASFRTVYVPMLICHRSHCFVWVSVSCAVSPAQVTMMCGVSFTRSSSRTGPVERCTDVCLPFLAHVIIDMQC